MDLRSTSPSLWEMRTHMHQRRYETVVFNKGEHLRLGDVDGMKERTLTVSSAGKVFNLTGWRIGWMTGPEDLIAGKCSPSTLRNRPNVLMGGGG